MKPISGTGSATPSRTKQLGCALALALALHAAALFGFRWTVAPYAPKPAVHDRGVSVDLVPAPEPKTAPVPAPTPEPAVKKEPAKPRPRKPETQKNTTAPANTAATTAATATRPAATAEQDAPLPTADPAPLPSYANPKPVYPELARKRGQQGLVRLLAHVDANGALTELSVVKSSGFSLLDRAALEAVRTWRFTPGMKNGLRVGGSVIVPVEFLLR